MFYNNQPKKNMDNYKNMLAIIGSLSNLFSDSDKPMIYYRAHENCFCKYFDADNLSRHDCSADARKNSIGIGLKTWVGSNNQKIAEFGKLRKELNALDDEKLIYKVSNLRNERIKTTMNMYGIKEMIYHILLRDENLMTIKECPFEFIDIDNLKRIPEKDGANTCYFTDGKNIYNFNKAKTTLYMIFDKLIHLDEIPVNIIDDPFDLLEKKNDVYTKLLSNKTKKNPVLCLKLYSENNKGYFVPQKSGLNQWNASGRKRNPNEIYIPFPSKDRNRIENKKFFPPKDTKFTLILPDGTTLSAKICQQDGKAIMSNPNKDLGKWLLRDVLELKEKELIDYNLLQQKGFDAVIFEKIAELTYTINFTDSKVYDDLYDND